MHAGDPASHDANKHQPARKTHASPGGFPSPRRA
ncbi:hypothetical protein RSgd_2246 [Ralstonia solanacearum]